MIVSELEYPIVQAPLAGGPSTVELAAAVCGAGGLGFIAGGYRSAKEMRVEIRELRQQTTAPFGVNIFVPGSPAIDRAGLDAYLERLQVESDRYGVKVGTARYDDDDWGAKLTVLHREQIPVVSFTFG
jgi:nitronate monooxygenase